jgi:hypothetical protein
MRVIAGVFVGLAIVAGGVGVYRWLSGDDDHSRERAEAAAREIDTRCQHRCDVVRLERVSDRFWRLHTRYGGSPILCMMLDLDEYRVAKRDSVYVGGAVYGISDTPCADDIWTGQDLSRRLEESSWARERKARFFSCHSVPPGEPNARRFGCRYSTPRGDGYVKVRTTGPDTFEVEE